MRIYINGIEEESFSFNEQPPPDSMPIFTNTSGKNQGIGFNSYYSSGGQSYEGYQSDIHFIDGQALGPEHFAVEDEFGYNPVKYTGTYGTNGFYLPFKAGEIGTDSSGNGNDFTVTGITDDDIVADSPTNNWCTLDPNQISAGPLTLAQGNLHATSSDGGVYGQYYPCAFGTMSAESGKWYAEFKSQGTKGGAGVAGLSNFPSEPHVFGKDGSNCFLTSTGELRGMSQDSSGYTAFGNGDIISVAMDLDNLKAYWAVNGAWITIGGTVGDPVSGQGGLAMDAISISGPYTFEWGNDTRDAPGIALANFGQRTFAYDPPEGYLALNSKNMENL
jgi:hypothetical protein